MASGDNENPIVFFDITIGSIVSINITKRYMIFHITYLTLKFYSL